MIVWNVIYVFVNKVYASDLKTGSFENRFILDHSKTGQVRFSDPHCILILCLFQIELVDWTSVEYYQPGVDSLDRDNIGILAKFRPRKKSFTDSSVFCVATTHLVVLMYYLGICHKWNGWGSQRQQPLARLSCCPPFVLG